MAFVLLLILLFLSNWPKIIFFQNKILFFLLALVSLFVILSFSRKRIILKILLVLALGILVIFQVRTTEVKNEYRLTPAETDLQIWRMNQFPASQARLGYWLETKKEMLLLDRLQNNFFNLFDLNLYFPNYFSFFTLPFFFLGIYRFIKGKDSFLFSILSFSLVLLVFWGIHGQLGPFLILPFFVLFILLGLKYENKNN
jgi:hypothetical protein